MGGAVSRVLAGLDGVRAWQEDLYRDLHEHPELSHREHRTAGIVAGRLRDFGLDVHDGVGGTGVVGVLRNGHGPTVLLRADMDALPIRETTGLPYASTATATDDAGNEVPVAHSCGHDMHTTCLLGAVRLLADATDTWRGTVVALFQPAEETGGGALGMVEDGLADIIPVPDVTFAQHVIAGPAGRVSTHPGPIFSAADNIRITVHGRGGHGSMPHASVDPVVLAAMIIVRLQTVVSREVAPTETAALTVGSIHAGTAGNVIADSARMELTVRTYNEETRSRVLDAIHRIVTAECAASACPREPEFEVYDRFPVTENDPGTTDRLAAAFADHFGDRAGTIGQRTASEDFSHIPAAFGAPYSYWVLGCTDADVYRRATEAGRIAQDVPVNHSPDFAPALQPTCDTGTEALVVATLAWIERDHLESAGRRSTT